MTTKFPGAKDDATTLPNTRTNATATENNHPPDHNNLADAILALETKVGIDNSPDANSLDRRVRQVLSKGATILDPTGALNIVVWRAPFACTVTAVRGRRDGGTGATINARKNGTLNHLAAALSLASSGAWASSTTIQNGAYAAGDTLEVMLVSLTGAPTSLAIQVEFDKT